MDVIDLDQVRWARRYFALQAVAGAVWWALVFAASNVQRWTLGTWDPAVWVVPDLIGFVAVPVVVAATGNRLAAATAMTWTVAVTVALSIYGLAEQAAGWGVVAMAIASVGAVAAAATLWSGQLPLHLFFLGPFRFRVAPSGSGRRHLARSLMQLVVFWATFFIAIPFVLAAIEHRLQIDAPGLDGSAWDVVGIIGFALGSIVGLWSCVTMAVVGKGTPLPSETARDLVVAGPYRAVRNPMAVAGAVQTASIGLWWGSWGVVVIAGVGALAWNTLIRPTEESDLAARFGPSYERYRAAVRCWWPTWRRP